MNNQKILVILDVKQANPRWTNYIREIADQGCEVDILIHHSGKNVLNTEIVAHPKIRIFHSYFISFYGRSRFLTKILSMLTKYCSSKKTFLSIYDFLAFHAFLVKGKKLSQKHKYSLVITSSSPFYAHLVGSRLRQNFNSKWIADYRDLWSFNHANSKTSQAQIDFERKIIANADACITVSRGMKNDLKRIFPGPIHVVYNGYRYLEDTREVLYQNSLAIEYTGQIYESNQNISEALEFFINSKYVEATQLNINFSGSSGIYISNYFKSKKMAIPKYFNCIGQISHIDALERQKAAAFLLFFNWVGLGDRGVVPGKIFEYIASGVPIIIIGQTSQIEMSKIINKSGYFFFVNSTTDLDKLIYSYTQGSLELPKRNKDFIGKFRYGEQAKIIVSIFRELDKERISVDIDDFGISLD